MKKRTIAIITARGGSKRIPKKNIRNFCGKPIIAYSIEAAIASGIYDEVMVSTDSQEIAEIAKKYGAKVPFMRSEKTADDYATTAEVLLEVLEEYKKKSQEFDYMTCIYPTAPFVTGKKLRDGMDKIMKEGCLAVTPVVEFSFPPLRAYVMNQDHYLTYKWEEYRNSRSQDLEKFYHDAGQFYFYDVEKYIKCKGQVKDSISAIVLPELEVQDIDNETDWKIAEVKFKLMQEANQDEII